MPNLELQYVSRAMKEQTLSNKIYSGLITLIADKICCSMIHEGAGEQQTKRV